jgi:hypothetical protein
MKKKDVENIVYVRFFSVKVVENTVSYSRTMIIKLNAVYHSILVIKGIEKTDFVFSLEKVIQYDYILLFI